MIDMNKIVESWIVKGLSIDLYMKTINELHKLNISDDSKESIEYRKNFNHFYKVRRDEEWRKIYYDFFEKNKNNTNLTFKDIITYLYNTTGNVEASFSSKMLATINPNMPIWDQFVLKNLGLEKEIPYYLKDEIKLEKSIQLYDEIVKWYDEYKKTEEYKICINRINELLPSYELSDVKKIDFIFWTNREMK